MCKGKLFLVAGILCVFNTHVLKVSAQVKTELGYKPGELLVRFAPKEQGRQINSAEKHSILNSLGGATVKHNYRIVPGLSLIKLPENMKVEDVLSVYNANEGILYAEPNYRTRALGTIPDDTNFGQQWGLHNVGQVAGKYDGDIDAPEAWEKRRKTPPSRAWRCHLE